MNISSDLEKLTTLQEIDLRITEQELSKTELPEKLAGMHGTIDDARQKCDSLEQKLEDARKEQTSLQEKINELTDHLAKSQERLNHIKTNREYDAVHAEIETAKSHIDNAETRTKTVAEEIAHLEKQRDEAQEDCKQISTELEPHIQDLTSRINAIDSTIADIRKERDAITQTIPKPVLKPYEHILERRKNGRVLAFICEKKPDCSICHKVLEPQVLNEVRGGNNLVMCQSCGSIILWKEPEEDE